MNERKRVTPIPSQLKIFRTVSTPAPLALRNLLSNAARPPW